MSFALTERLTVADLTFPEQMVLWAVRHWRAGGGDWRKVEREFQRACGPAAARIALDALDRMLGAIEQGACHGLDCHALCCGGVSPDEQCVLALLAAGQADDGIGAKHAALSVAPPCRSAHLLELAAVAGAALDIGLGPLPARYAMRLGGETVH
jgi:hypothetical protein